LDKKTACLQLSAATYRDFAALLSFVTRFFSRLAIVNPAKRYKFEILFK